ncbi:MAG: beta-ketoacyl synthase N-terminal-like domain-containing protein [Actinoplanes sp.]
MNDEDMQTAVAVIAVAARIPGAADLDEFWDALTAGRDLTTRLDSRRRYGVVAGTDRFDATFFGMAPREAQLLDPQERVFLECAWEALEHAGYDPGTYPGVIGVYAGSSETDHLAALRAQRHRFPETTDEQLRLAGSRDFLTGRVAYKLNLRGPAVTVHTACSTSAVAVHLAGQALLAGECDMALAGGVALRGSTGAEAGDDLLSPDGHCRPFDADADGMVGADGAGIVVLKRLSDALADRDHIDAVLLGSALSNDGSDKVGFAAPSVTGQLTAARTAHLAAGIDPHTIGYVEAHGTGTRIGDTIEVRALSQAYGPGAPGRCVLSSVKSNIGHADAAAGVLGLIKVVLSLRHGLIPGTAHFRRPNPLLDLTSGPFVVTSEATPWPPGDSPRRAGVNATGIGGTNAHLLVQEAPVAPVSPDDGRYHLLPLSARTATALAESAARLRAWLQQHPVPIADVAWTLQTGRAAFAHRTFVVCRDREEAIAALAAPAEIGGSLHATGLLWQDGQSVHWPALHDGRPPRRVPLPAYPFERERFALDDATPAGAPEEPAAGPSTQVEKTIAEVWCEVLRVPQVGIDDDFFALGGHSLHATRVLARLGPALGPDAPGLTIMDLFDHSTIRELAALVSREPE